MYLIHPYGSLGRLWPAAGLSDGGGGFDWVVVEGQSLAVVEPQGSDLLINWWYRSDVARFGEFRIRSPRLLFRSGVT
ncbi:hypothetical protein RchiOBHm_Chr1g0352431 [Rosa chinensis]|uniref:Uncharacterized protein n=1 Tax=Rosa chinensis TaxID=74649 RepID=A0A2P6SGL4_ROSCH|nr:hypothetical protein RchiOBHm_Chr1g0352431 [Rosa chinensis]